jgi:hypothetical protein
MPRKLVFLIVFLALIVASMFFLASIDAEQEPKLVEEPVIGTDLN